MRAKEFGFIIAFLIVLMLSVACTQTGTTQPAEEKSQAEGTKATETATATAVPQLESDAREDSATMVLLNAPPMLPADHKSFWNPEQRQESCMVCHATPETGAPTPTKEHYYDEKVGGKIFRDNCIQCHATQNDTKAAFNEQ